MEAHRKAVSNGHFTYDDPITGLKVSFLAILIINPILTNIGDDETAAPPEGILLWVGLSPLCVFITKSSIISIFMPFQMLFQVFTIMKPFRTS